MRLVTLSLCLFIHVWALAQIKKAPELKEGEGPFTQLIIRGVTLVNAQVRHLWGLLTSWLNVTV
jgi:hypothetical protein